MSLAGSSRWRLSLWMGRVAAMVLVIAAASPASAQIVTSWLGVDSLFTNSSNWSAGIPSGPDAMLGEAATAELTSTGEVEVFRSLGAATVTGVGSTLTSTQMTIGGLGQGSLVISDGGSVVVSEGRIAEHLMTETLAFFPLTHRSQGSVQVTGPGSTWEVAGLLAVGNRGDGSLAIAAGGSVIAAEARLARLITTEPSAGTFGGPLTSRSAGSAHVTGADSTWQVSGQLIVGDQGDGSLTIADGGTVIAGLISLDGGTLNATGANSIDGDIANNGIISGPSGDGQYVALGGNVSGAGSYAGNVEFRQRFSPGNSTATVLLENVQFAATSELLIELGGLLDGQFDRLEIGGDAMLDGQLLVFLIDGFTPSIGDQFEILDVAGTLSGTFAGLDEGSVFPAASGQLFGISYVGGRVTIARIPEPSAGGLLLAGCLAILFPRRRS